MEKPGNLNAPFLKILPQVQALILITLCGLLVFFGTLHAPFQYDDAHAIVENPYIKNLSEFQNEVGVQNIFNRSILLLSFSINHEFGELNVFGFHLINIFIHICVGVLLFLIARELIPIEPSPKPPRLRHLPLLASAIHMFNPVNVQAVTYLSNRSSLLATLFYLLGFFYFIRFVHSLNSKEDWFHKLLNGSLFLLFLFLGAGTKAIIITLPVIALTYLWFRVPRPDAKIFLVGTGLILVPLAAYLFHRYTQLGGIFKIQADPGSMSIDRVHYFLTQFHVMVFYYLSKCLLPLNLNFEPDVRLISGISDPRWSLGLFSLIILAWGLFLQKSQLLKFAFFWFFVTVLPTSSLIPLKQIASEHRTYLPGLGISLCLALLFIRHDRFFRQGFSIVLAFLILTSALTLNRGMVYRSEISLWEDTARKSPRKALVHNNLATAYIPEGRYELAIRELETTLELDPSTTNAHINMGRVYFLQERWRDSMRKFDQAILLGSPRPEAFYNAGLVRMRLELPGEAIPFFKEAVRIKSLNPEYRFNLGYAYQNAGLLDEALNEFRITLAQDPNYYQAHNNMGVIFWKIKAYERAEKKFLQALKFSKDIPKIHNNLVSIYMITKKYDKAVYHLNQLLKLQPENPKALELLPIATTLSETIFNEK